MAFVPVASCRKRKGGGLALSGWRGLSRMVVRMPGRPSQIAREHPTGPLAAARVTVGGVRPPRRLAPGLHSGGYLSGGCRGAVARNIPPLVMDPPPPAFAWAGIRGAKGIRGLRVRQALASALVGALVIAGTWFVVSAPSVCPPGRRRPPLPRASRVGGICSLSLAWLCPCASSARRPRSRVMAAESGPRPAFPCV